MLIFFIVNDIGNDFWKMMIAILGANATLADWMRNNQDSTFTANFLMKRKKITDDNNVLLWIKWMTCLCILRFMLIHNIL